MSFKKANVEAFRSRVRSSFRKKIEEDIIFERAEIAIRTAYMLIDLSPVLTGTYINAHTIEINGIRVREPDVKIVPIVDTIPIPLIKEFASRNFMSNEYEILLRSPVTSSITIVMPDDVVYWGIDYVEPKYMVYHKAAAVEKKKD